MKRMDAGTEGVSSVLEDSGGQGSLTLLVSNLVKRIEQNGDEGAIEKLAALVVDGDNPERYVAYCSLREMDFPCAALDLAIAAFEENPANQRLIEIWRECSE